MKIKTLSIRNIASIETADIDFTKGALGNAPLFLICGETGSGKTTILDCITLTLYGATPRYSGKSEHYPQEIGGYAYNDVRQLVRRGSRDARAAVTLVGNDGKTYEAKWSVEAVSRGPNKGTLKDEEWTWKDCSTGGLTYAKVRECESVAKQAVGLDFSQFCRTTMLAQGQFTKFLLGEPKEKAEILEKLTDTTKYSALGKAIFEKYKKIKDAKDKIEDEIRRMTGLGDQRSQIEARVKELSSMIGDLEAKRKTADAKLRWLKRKDELEANRLAVRGELVEAVAGLKALEIAVAHNFEEAKLKVEALKAYLGGRASKAGMLESAEVILANLCDIRNARTERARAEKELSLLEQTLPGHKERLETAANALENALGKVATADSEVNAEERALEALGRRNVQKARDDAEKLRGNLLGVEGRMKGFAGQFDSIAKREKSMSAMKTELAELEEKVPGLKTELLCSSKALEQAQTRCDEQKKLVDAGIEGIIAELKVGDVCPICGNKIESLRSGGHFESLFRELDAECRKAKDAFKEKELVYNKAAARVEALRKNIESETALVAEEKSRIEDERRATLAEAKLYGAKDGTAEGVRTAVEACGAEIAGLDGRLKAIDEQEMKVKDLKKALKKAEKARDEAKNAKIAAEKELLNNQNRIDSQKIMVKHQADIEKNKAEDVAGRVSGREWLEAWERDHDSVEAELSAEAREYALKKAELPKAESARDALEKSSGQIAGCIARAVGKVPELSDVEADKREGISTSAVDGLLGRFDESQKSMARHLEERPADFADDEGEESLAEISLALKVESDKLYEERGRCQQQIADDDKCATERTAKQREADRLEAERMEWSPINDRLGDNSGDKIRREIQSYVLANVLVKANYYLRQLSERYELSCEGLTLSVVDSFEGGAVRPVNTLSGGEQFLVSLALALGLAGMNDTGLGVDMLLIDEGFGTLSGEHLNSAIEALERLNAITGSRKVGVISHVERLRERIQTHIEVTRRGHDPSVVRVTPDYVS